MALSAPTQALAGSERPALPGYRAGHGILLDSVVRAVLKLRPSADVTGDAERIGRTPPLQREVPSRDRFGAMFGASEADVALVVQFTEQFGLMIERIDPCARLLVVRGSAKAIGEAFATELVTFESADGRTYRGYGGTLRLPPELTGIVRVVTGLDDRTIALRPDPVAAPAAIAPYEVAKLAKRYQIPAGVTGAGQRVALLQFEAGYSADDLKQYFGTRGHAVPAVTIVAIGGYQLDPKRLTEPMLDLEVLGTIAPDAELIAYFAEQTEAGWLESLTTAVHSREHPASVISISYCYPESGGPYMPWVPAMIEEINRTLAEAAWLGTTVTVASGDHGAMSWLNDGSVHAEFPASSPFVLGCGGTALQIGEDGVEREVVWKTDANHGTGGGVSECFERPAWQVTANVPLSLTTKFAGRGVPDVAAYADLAVGYVIRANGQDTRGGGTSAAAPLWAGLIALINERLTAKAGVTAGYITPLLYDHIALSAFHDVEDGDNNGYAAGPDWDPCTGWGSPNGAELLRQLTTNENSARAPSRQRRGHRASSSAS